MKIKSLYPKSEKINSVSISEIDVLLAVVAIAFCAILYWSQ